MINPNPATIEDLLNSSIQLEVPRYQREYKWGTNEAGDFWEDLKSYADSGEGSLFLGTLIFDIAEKESKKSIKIVDGQQRITTILILLIACRKLAEKINSQKIANKIQDKISFENPTTGEFVGCRLIASESIKEVFQHLSNANWNGVFPEKLGSKQVKRQVNRIRPIFDYFSKQIEGYDHTYLSHLLETIYKSYIVRIDIQEEIEAFKIFERTNARGMDLEASDLLKNYLFSQAGSVVEDYWYQIIELSEGTALRMLKYFYVSKNGYVTKSDLYKKLKAYGKSTGHLEMVQELEKFASFYNAIRSADEPKMKNYFGQIGLTAIEADQEKFQEIYFSIEGLRLFKITQIYPLISAAIDCYIRNGFGENNNLSKKLIKFFNTLENYHFINNAICERIGNEVEKLYSDYSKIYAQSDSFDDVTHEFYLALKGQIAVQDEFVSRFIDISYQLSSIPLISYIYDRINNMGAKPGHRVKIFYPDEKILRRNHNIEHFYPQKPNPVDNLPTLTAEEIDNIGNLLTISFRTNSKLSNFSPRQKSEMLSGELLREIQNLDYVRKFLEVYKDDVNDWGKEAISKRARDLAEIAYNSVWRMAI